MIDDQLMPSPQNVAALAGSQRRPPRLRDIGLVDRRACLLHAHVGKFCQHFAARRVEDFECPVTNRRAKGWHTVDGSKQVRGFQVPDHRQAQGQYRLPPQGSEFVFGKGELYSASAGSL